MGIIDRLRASFTRAMVKGSTILIERAEAEGRLRMTRRASRPSDAVTPERLSAVTYELVVTNARGVEQLRTQWNPDRGNEVEPPEMAAQAGEVAGMSIRQAVIAGAIAETLRAADGHDPDVDLQAGVGRSERSLDGEGLVHTTWRYRDQGRDSGTPPRSGPRR